MPNFVNLAQFVASITARFNKPKRSLVNEGIVKQDVIDALSDCGKWAEDVRQEAQALNASFVARSLISATSIYVDTVNGNDTRTGETNNANSTTGCVKTLDRVIALHSGKTTSLRIFVSSGILDITKDYTIVIPFLEIRLEGGATGITFRKKTIIDGNAINVGEGNYRILCQSLEIYLNNVAGRVEVEAHGGSTGTGNQQLYRIGQGALAIASQSQYPGSNYYGVINFYNWGATFILGANTTFAVSGTQGIDTVGSTRHLYKKIISVAGTETIGANATENTLLGDRVYPRQYHPISSTDSKVAEGEMVLSPTNNKLWIKRAGTIRDSMGTTFV